MRTHTHANDRYHILEFCSHFITDVPSVELLEVSPIFCGSKTTIKSVISSTPTPENIEWQTSRDGVDFHSMKKTKYFDNTDSSFVIHKATFADKLYYRLRVWNGIGETISNMVYLNVTGSMIFIFIYQNFKFQFFFHKPAQYLYMQRVPIKQDHHIFSRSTKYKDHSRNKHQKQISKIDWQRDYL